jgi:hypothetical protein
MLLLVIDVKQFLNYPPCSMHFSHLISFFGQLIILLFLCTCFRYCWTYANITHAGLFENFCLTAWLRWLYYWSIQIICMWLLTMYLQNWQVHEFLSIFSQYKQRMSRLQVITNKAGHRWLFRELEKMKYKRESIGRM